MRTSNIFILTLCLMTVFLPGTALAGTGIADFAGPVEKVMQTLTGDTGKWISIIAMALCGVVFIVQKEDLSGGFKMLLSVVFAISFIAFAGSIVNKVFTFSGAMVA